MKVVGSWGIARLRVPHSSLDAKAQQEHWRLLEKHVYIVDTRKMTEQPVGAGLLAPVLGAALLCRRNRPVCNVSCSAEL